MMHICVCVSVYVCLQQKISEDVYGLHRQIFICLKVVGFPGELYRSGGDFPQEIPLKMSFSVCD